jgi:hypothetical protein
MDWEAPDVAGGQSPDRYASVVDVASIPSSGWWVRQGRTIVLDAGAPLSKKRFLDGEGEGEGEQFLGGAWRWITSRGRGAPGPAPSPTAAAPAPPKTGHPYRDWPEGVPRPLPPAPSSAPRIPSLRKAIAKLERLEGDARSRWYLLRGTVGESRAREDYFRVWNALRRLRARLQAAQRQP